jgi:hypothetical protein
VNSWFNFLEYARLRRKIFADPGYALAGPGRASRSLTIRFLSQGLIFPAAFVLFLAFIYATIYPNSQTTEVDRSEALKSAIQILEAELITGPQNHSVTEAQIAMFNQQFARERIKHFTVLTAAFCDVVMVPIAILLLCLNGHRWMPGTHLRREEIEQGVARILGSHLFWINLANSVFVGWVVTMLAGNPEYGFAARVELLYALLLTLLSGSVSYKASRALNGAFKLPSRSAIFGYFLGDRLRWILYGILCVLTIPCGLLPYLLPFWQS